MTGLPDHNFPAFNRAAAALRSRGLEVFNPAENATNGQEDEARNGRAHYMRLDIFAIIGRDWNEPPVDAVVLLPGWERSRGARLEVEIAMQLDIPLLWAEDLTPLNDLDLARARKFRDREYLRPNYRGVPA